MEDILDNKIDEYREQHKKSFNLVNTEINYMSEAAYLGNDDDEPFLDLLFDTIKNVKLDFKEGLTMDEYIQELIDIGKIRNVRDLVNRWEHLDNLYVDG